MKEEFLKDTMAFETSVKGGWRNGSEVARELPDIVR
jgi:hypothetical protein